MKKNITLLILLTGSLTFLSFNYKDSNKMETQQKIDHSKKAILARGCDATMSAYAAKMIPPEIGNPQYIPTTNDVEFIKQLKTKKWSVVFFAPGACRFSAAKQQIPGGNLETASWTLEEYKELVYKYQGKDIQIVETTEESKTIGLLKLALEKANDVL